MIPAIVLAAGRSQRMGEQKLVLPFQGQPLVTRVVDALLSGPVDPVYVVVGSSGKLVIDALAGRPVHLVTNPSPECEMLDSVRCGVRALPVEAVAVVVALGDQPGLTASLVTRLVEAFRNGDRGIAVPTCDGRRGHPLVIAMRYRDELLTRHAGRGLRGLIAAHPQDVLELPVAAADILEDIDLPEDYQRAIASVMRHNERP
jgi:molybdenum cofactor cytidylyltransferase